MTKSSSGAAPYFRVVPMRKRKAHGPVAELVMTPRAADGSHSITSQQQKRPIGRNRACSIVLDLLKALDAPPELAQQVEALKEPDHDEEGEPVTADATPEEIQAVERLVGRWQEAVSQALAMKAISGSTAATYRQHPENFLGWVKGEFQPGSAGRRRRVGTQSGEGSDPEE
jgi:hypothetical protein